MLQRLNGENKYINPHLFDFYTQKAYTKKVFYRFVKGFFMQETVFLAQAAALFGAAFVMGLGSIGPSLGQGLSGMKACENIGKYPENDKQIRNAMFLSMALVETSAIYCGLVAGALIWAAFSIAG